MEVLQMCDQMNEAIDEGLIFALFGSKLDKLECEDFTLESYINESFPNEQSLSSLPEKIGEMTKILEEIDSDIGKELRNLASNNLVARFEENLKIFESELIPKIKEKEVQDELFKKDVEFILGNICELDQVHINLTSSVNLLKSLSIGNIIRDEIKSLMNTRAYSELVPILILGYGLSTFLKSQQENSTAMIEIKGQNKRDKVCQEIQNSLSETEKLFGLLKQQITEDFLALIDPYILFLGGIDHQDNINSQITPPQHLEAPEEFRKQMKSCCYCVELIGDDFRAEIVDMFTTKLLEPYCRLFSYSQTENFFGTQNKTIGQNKEKLTLSATGVEFIERRFGWYRRCMKEYEQQFGEIFLTNWELQTILTEKFVACTRKDLLQTLGDIGHLLDHQVIFEYSSKCHQFEEYITSRFAQSYDQQILFAELEKENFQEVLNIKIKNKAIREFGNKFKTDYEYISHLNVSNPTNSESSKNKLKQEMFDPTFSFHDGRVRYPQIKGLLTECFVPYLTSFLELEKESILKKVTRELAPDEKMTENIQIRRETDFLGQYETIPLIWTSSKSLSHLINSVFQQIEHLLDYDDIYLQFNTLILQIVQTYIDQKVTSCNIQRALDKITNNNIYSGGSSFENIVEAVVTTVSTQTSKVAATTGGILFTSTSHDHINSELKYNARRLAATLGSIDYLEWIHSRLECMFKGSRLVDTSKFSEANANASSRDLRPRGQNVIFSNYMWVSKRKILGCIVRELSRPITLSMSEWYTKKTQKLNETMVAKGISESELPTLGSSFTDGTSSLAQVLGESLVKQYVQYSQYMPTIYKYNIISQVMMHSLKSNWKFVISLKGPLHYGTLEVVANEQQKLSSLFLELPSYFPAIYVPRAYVENVKIIVNKGIVFLRIAQKKAAQMNNFQLDKTSIQHFTTQLYKNLEIEPKRGELSAFYVNLALKLGNNTG
ncbi:Vps53-N family involved invacuolar sorting [Cryptosporidium sp. chipmunk genotype I]|uniref:Vps53-N family involved invacuolar sorting n=1 Tax=Cryptosporidium sp. chipmunk genotype I TaxID=1280935 RepID=UPI003519F4DA|nr:Vps53-N family involved invacuolar sorting [Cryptosporidium sp. chipmunk genotype I]